MTDIEKLVERANICRSMIGNMCSENRPPKMEIPARNTENNEDVFICETFKELSSFIRDRCIPELPEGWLLGNLYQIDGSAGYVCVLLPKESFRLYATGKRGAGKTAVEAINNAIGEIDREIARQEKLAKGNSNG